MASTCMEPHVITVVHLLNSPVLNRMINSCEQYFLCYNVYSYLIFVSYMYFTELIKRLTLLSPGNE